MIRAEGGRNLIGSLESYLL